MKAKKSPCTSVSSVLDAVMMEENEDDLQETMLEVGRAVGRAVVNCCEPTTRGEIMKLLPQHSWTLQPSLRASLHIPGSLSPYKQSMGNPFPSTALPLCPPGGHPSFHISVFIPSHQPDHFRPTTTDTITSQICQKRLFIVETLPVTALR